MPPTTKTAASRAAAAVAERIFLHWAEHVAVQHRSQDRGEKVTRLSRNGFTRCFEAKHLPKVNIKVMNLL